ncbi:hypothetical protein TNIN_151351 [Trichonephila inaurata madagascariensis]|uniref:Uncharacterized protein n=1 Tax=Trichonephila inaurata madagascariensis TaxID=2747483 RepID=A0A8X6YCI8_9ARAC|nr:hypothetical protein TNIN_151351 [Trichonephila inaurata madagascariensis]
MKADGVIRHFHDAPTAGHLGFAKTIRPQIDFTGFSQTAVVRIKWISLRFLKSAHGNKWILVCTGLVSTLVCDNESLADSRSRLCQQSSYHLKMAVPRHGALEQLSQIGEPSFRSRLVSRRLV